MSDYFNNLLARTLSLAPVVRPRLASLFEPSSYVAADFIKAPPPAKKTHEDETRTQPVLDLSRPFGNSDGFKPETSQRNDERSMFASEIPISVPARATTPEAYRLSDLTHQITEPVIRLKSIRTAADEAAVSESSTQFQKEVPSVGGVLGTEPLSAARRDPLETPAVRAVVTRVNDSLIQVNQVSAFASTNASSALPAPEAEPTISITIGRVDVRAVFPQPQTQRPRPVHPGPMSLDEYLARRNEGQ
jgi:hypothetical protein